MARWIVRIVVGVLVMFLALGLVAAGLSAKDYGTPAFWAPPDRINFCGRRYYRDSHAIVRNRATWRPIGHTFGLRPIYADHPTRPVPGSVCTFVLYVGRPFGGYSEYDLSGGP